MDIRDAFPACPVPVSDATAFTGVGLAAGGRCLFV
jgi:hypothetical protein